MSDGLGSAPWMHASHFVPPVTDLGGGVQLALGMQAMNTASRVHSLSVLAEKRGTLL